MTPFVFKNWFTHDDHVSTKKEKVPANTDHGILVKKQDKDVLTSK